MHNSHSQAAKAIRCISGTLLNLLLLAYSVPVLAGGGHSHGSGAEFGSSSSGAGSQQVSVDAQTARRIGIKVEPAKRQRLAVGIKTSGQIETLPNQKVEVTTPISGAKVVELLVEPGASVKKGQPVAVVSSLDLVTLRVESQEKLAQGQADLQQAQADFKLAQQNYERYQQIAAAEIAEAQSQVSFAQERYNKDKELADAGALPRRNALESQTKLAEAKALLTRANNRRDVIEAENQLKRSQAAVTVANSRINLSNDTYQTRLSQLGTRANAKGLVTVTAPISGKVADREVTLGQSFEDAGGKLMTIANDSRVFATANIYEKDLDKVRQGQRVSLKVASVPDRTFTGRIAVIGSAVAGETRVVSVKAEINNPEGVLKPGMFAELEVLTDQTSSPIVAIPASAVVEANGKKLVYVQNGNVYQSVEVTLGQTSGDMVEIKTGLFEEDIIVTQLAPQLYAQSLLGGNKAKDDGHDEAAHTPEATLASTSGLLLPWWLILAAGGAIATGTFWTGTVWANRRTQPRVATVGNSDSDTPIYYEVETYLDHNSKHSPLVDSHHPVSKQEDNH